MEYVHLGRSGVLVSRLCLGTMNLGVYVSEEDSHALLERALELGINFVDTADGYGRSVHVGYTEEIIGRWFARGGERRDKVVLATKVYGHTGDWPNQGRLSARHIREACDASLRRLQTDRIDLYQMHHIDRATPWEEIWQAMAQLHQAGKILYVGSSNFAAWNIAQAQERASTFHVMGLVSEQSKYSLLTRAIELEVIPACRAYGVGIIPWSPLESGLLGGILSRPPHGGRRAESGIQARLARHRDQVQAYEALCAELGESPATVALAWMLRNPAVTAPIIGPREIAQLNDSMRVLEVTLSDDVLARLDDIFPGPSDQAPEAYAW